MASPYLVPIAQLRRDMPATQEVSFRAPFDADHEFEPRGPVETDVDGEAEVVVALRLESFSGGLRARGRVEAPWHGVCRRCSLPVTGQMDIRVDERFVEERGPGDDEAYLIDHDVVDLAPLVHDAILLDLPLAPLCRPDCQGLCPQCGVDRNVESCDCQAPLDPRWATLDGLRFPDASSVESGEA